MRSPAQTPYDIDEVLADSFPASDPPAWTPGIARTAPPVASGTPAGSREPAWQADVRTAAARRATSR